MKNIARHQLLVAISVALVVRPVLAVDFESEVAPILVRHCAACHNPTEKAGSLDLLSRQGTLAAGDSELVAITPGNLAGSYLVDRISAAEMPPPGKGKPLTAKQVETLKEWIASGAEWPSGRTLSPFEMTTEERAGKDWWSLQPPQRPDLPIVKRAVWPRNPIDTFVLAKLASQELQPSPEADRVTLLRRAKLDLHGLPPSPEEVRQFVNDPAPDAYERLIDRLLDAPEYGERWARHWLDVIRFAESTGYETNVLRPNAWPYRDYVIEAFNRDIPYTQFITEQLAGDTVGADVATSFLVAGPSDQVNSPDIELTRAQRQADLDDMISTTTTAFLGLTAGCAKCHDHKFDPISQLDYYSLQGIFAGVQHGERQIRRNSAQEKKREVILGEIAAIEESQQRMVLGAQPLAQVTQGSETTDTDRPPVHARRNFDRFPPVSARYVKFAVQATNQLEPCIDELEIFTAEDEPRNVALASANAIATASSVFANGTYPLHKLEHLNDGKYGNARSWISGEAGAGWVQIELPKPMTISCVVWGRDREDVFTDRLPTNYTIEVAIKPDEWQIVASSSDRQPFVAGAKEVLPADAATAEYVRLERKIELLHKQAADLAPQMAYAGKFVEPSEPTYRLHRGEPMQQREEVNPGGIEAVGLPLKLAASTPEAERRQALARWLANERNPLTARVMVNRIWHYHFGQGLVKNPSDFGFQSGLPSHPELLDWLATEFMQNGWRPKHIHRLIMLSNTYHQASTFRSQAAAVDGGNTFLWRFAPRRLEAEAIRDTILAISGALNTDRGGIGFDVFEPNTNYVKVYTPRQSFGPEHFRRMIYMTRPRMQFDATFGAFDCPDSAQPLAKRHVSTTALQALNLLNSPFIVQQAELFADRLKREAGTDVSAQVQRAFWLAFSRKPQSTEQTAAEKLIAAEGLPAFCRGLLNANELVFIP